MAQASIQWQQFMRQIQDSTRTVLDSTSFKHLSQQFEQVKGTLLSLAVLVVLLVWSWQLVLALAIGLLVVIVVYLAQQGELHLVWLNWQQWLSPANRSLTLAIGVGGTAAISTYLATAIWLEVGTSWVTVGIILQGLATLAVLMMMLWRSLLPSLKQQNHQDLQIHRWLIDLADSDPLKRLLAVRQTTQWMVQRPPRSERSLPITPTHLAGCFRVMLDRETEPAVCNALLESLHALNNTPQLPSGSEPWSIPIDARGARVKVHRHPPATS